MFWEHSGVFGRERPLGHRADMQHAQRCPTGCNGHTEQRPDTAAVQSRVEDRLRTCLGNDHWPRGLRDPTGEPSPDRHPEAATSGTVHPRRRDRDQRCAGRVQQQQRRFIGCQARPGPVKQVGGLTPPARQTTQDHELLSYPAASGEADCPIVTRRSLGDARGCAGRRFTYSSIETLRLRMSHAGRAGSSLCTTMSARSAG